MNIRTVTTDRWQRRSLGGLLCLVALAPAFAWAAAQTGYAEPMDNAVELAGVSAEIVPTGISLFPDYALQGLGPYAGTFGGALLGTMLTLGIALCVGRLLATGT